MSTMKYDPPSDRRPLIVLTEDTINEACRTAMRILAEAKVPIHVCRGRLVQIVASDEIEIPVWSEPVAWEPASSGGLFKNIPDYKSEKRTRHIVINVSVMDLKIMLEDHIRWRRGNRDTNSGREIPRRILAMRDEWPFPVIDEDYAWPD
jgi:hypothetical protein